MSSISFSGHGQETKQKTTQCHPPHMIHLVNGRDSVKGLGLFSAE